MFGLFGFKVKLEMVLLFKIFVFDLFSESLFFCFIFFKPPFILLLDSFDHVIEFLQMIVMCPFHFLAFGHVLIFENLNITPELFLKASNSRILDRQ